MVQQNVEIFEFSVDTDLDWKSGLPRVRDRAIAPNMWGAEVPWHFALSKMVKWMCGPPNDGVKLL